MPPASRPRKPTCTVRSTWLGMPPANPARMAKLVSIGTKPIRPSTHASPLKARQAIDAAQTSEAERRDVDRASRRRPRPRLMRDAEGGDDLKRRKGDGDPEQQLADAPGPKSSGRCISGFSAGVGASRSAATGPAMRCAVTWGARLAWADPTQPPHPEAPARRSRDGLEGASRRRRNHDCACFEARLRRAPQHEGGCGCDLRTWTHAGSWRLRVFSQSAFCSLKYFSAPGCSGAGGSLAAASSLMALAAACAAARSSRCSNAAFVMA